MAENLDEIVGRWTAAEDRLHPLVLVQPETYERYLRLVRMVANDLEGARTGEQLVEAYGGARAIVQSTIAREGFPAAGLDLQLVAGAAFGLRYREVLAEIRRDEIRRRIRTAEEGGDEWVVLSDVGGAGGLLFPPYRKVEMHLPDGLALHSFVDFDENMDRPVFGVEVVRLDPRTGTGVAGTDVPFEPARTFAERGPWETAVEGLRVRLGGNSA